MPTKIGGYSPSTSPFPKDHFSKERASSLKVVSAEEADFASKLNTSLENGKIEREKVKSTSEKISSIKKNIVLVVKAPAESIEKKAKKFRIRYIMQGLEALSYVPVAVEFFAKINAVKQLAGIPGFCIDIILTGHDLYKKVKSSARHNKWIKKLEPEHPRLNPDELKGSLNALIGNLKVSGKNLSEMRNELGKWGIDLGKYKETKHISSVEELFHKLENKKFLKKIFPDYADKAASVEGAHRLLKKSEERFDQKIEEKRAEFGMFIKELSGPLDEVKRKLKARGIDIDAMPAGKTIKSTLELKSKLSNPSFEESLFKPLLKEYARPYAEKAIARSVLLNNPLKALSLMKQKSEKVFFNFKLFQASNAFAVTLVSSVALIALKVMIVVGLISIPALIGTGIGIGAAAVILGAAGVGLFILYKYKPETFKAMIKGKNLWLMEKRLSSTYHHWRLDKKRERSQAYNEALQVYSAHAYKNPELLPKEFKSARARHLNKRIEKSKQKYAGNETKLNEIDDIMFKQMRAYAAKKIKVDREFSQYQSETDKVDQEKDAMRAEMVKAGWDDFKNRVKLHGPNDSREGDMAKKIAEALTELYSAGELDQDVQKVLQNEMGIDIGQVFKTQGEKGLEIALQTFFSKNTVQLDKFLRRQVKQGVFA